MGSIEKKIGQMLLVGFRGCHVSGNDPIARDIEDLNLGGVLLFDYDMTLGQRERNIQSPDQLAALTSTLQAFAETPLFISVDQEGGQVSRLKEDYGFPPTVSAWELGEIDDPAETRRQAEACAVLLSGLGINLNFAPDVDLRINPDNPIIGAKNRSYGSDPQKVIRHAREFLRAHRERGVACAIKHFPGHGSSFADTHLGLTDVTATWQEAELKPFEELIVAGDCSAVMTAHIFNSRLDPVFPATLSRRVIKGILRDRFKFDGAVFSDDLEMGAISSRYGLEAAVFNAITAGVDVLVFANNTTYQPDIAGRVISIVKGFISDGIIDERRIDESFGRIMRMKERLPTKDKTARGTGVQESSFESTRDRVSE